MATVAAGTLDSVAERRVLAIDDEAVERHITHHAFVIQQGSLLNTGT